MTTINDFAERVVIVTGGASGMGAASVQEFVSRGALVARVQWVWQMLVNS